MNLDEYSKDMRRHSAIATEIECKRMKLREARRAKPRAYAITTYNAALRLTVRDCEVPSANVMADVLADALRADRRVRHIRIDNVLPAGLSQRRDAARDGNAASRGDAENAENGKDLR